MKITNDRRIDRTKKALREAILALIVEKPISKISITELCNIANINRATFYAHYDTQEELLRSIETEEVDKFINFIKKWIPLHPNADVEYFFTEALKYVYGEREIWKTLLCNNRSPHFSESLSQSIRDLALPFLFAELTDFHFAAQYAAEFISGGFVSITRKALVEDFKGIGEGLSKDGENLNSGLVARLLNVPKKLQ